MRSLGIICFCVLTALVYLSSLNSSYSPSSMVSLSPPITTPFITRKMGVPSSIMQSKIEVTEDRKKPTAEGNPVTVKYDSSDNLDELVYHTDYHGATTHPIPTPKHPMP
ncbi:uncharacterized protein LOC115725267 [Cannabis sativa]|uniref:uncharacterized protein LOC115725267 n=1 Tax=Cannabis sativa TaxID=3483 RepID=UPI0011DFF204|nr:uncharacterized protein LOC115725267 [Cannabis sativa]